MSVVADTHALVWYLDAPHELSGAGVAALDAAADAAGEHVVISAITLVEVRYLVEKGRLKADVLARIEQELDEPDPIIIIAPLDRATYNALTSVPRETVPDMPDRIIAATALNLGLSLVTRDADIRSLTNVRTIW